MVRLKGLRAAAVVPDLYAKLVDDSPLRLLLATARNMKPGDSSPYTQPVIETLDFRGLLASDGRRVSRLDAAAAHSLDHIPGWLGKAR